MFDDALRVVFFEHQTARALAQLAGDPEDLAGYRDEAQEIAETETGVRE